MDSMLKYGTKDRQQFYYLSGMNPVDGFIILINQQML